LEERAIQCAEHVTLLADSTKFRKTALLQFASIDHIDDIITEKKWTNL
jgi:DeoR/GlpR family transcriptional regulator of sugar metabolism